MEVNLISLRSLKITKLLTAITLFLVVASVLGQLAKLFLGYKTLKGLVPLFNLNGEQNIPTVFSALLLFFASGLLLVIGVLNKKFSKPDITKWFILSLALLMMGFDEICSIHEKLTSPFRALLGNHNLGIFYFAWVIPGLVIIGLAGLFFFKFFLRLPKNTQLTLLISVTMYFSGAIGVELIGGAYSEAHGGQNLVYLVLTTVEESLEMFGVVGLIQALLDYIAQGYQDVTFRVLSPSSSQRALANRS